MFQVCLLLNLLLHHQQRKIPNETTLRQSRLVNCFAVEKLVIYSKYRLSTIPIVSSNLWAMPGLTKFSSYFLPLSIRVNIVHRPHQSQFHTVTFEDWVLDSMTKARSAWLLWEPLITSCVARSREARGTKMNTGPHCLFSSKAGLVSKPITPSHPPRQIKLDPYWRWV